MAAELPFLPAVKSGAAGQTVSIAVGSSSASTSIDSTGLMNPSLLVTLDGAVAGTAFIRLSVEGVSIVATTTDTPLPYGPNPTIRLFANPAPSGKANIAVIGASTPNVTTTVWITPGEGGVL